MLASQQSAAYEFGPDPKTLRLSPENPYSRMVEEAVRRDFLDGSTTLDANSNRL
jgi:hypothetical protein